jgi:uncharacterized phage protein gp47/JayE
MPSTDYLDSTGLHTSTQADLVTKFTDAMESIYGADIDLSPNTPDGQMMMIYIQDALDLRDLLHQIYNSMNPDTAIGAALDSRVTMNGIQRQGGTFSRVDVTVTFDDTISSPLVGLSDDNVNPYTVADDQGNNWQLVATQNPVGPGSDTYAFQAEFPGAVTVQAHKITVPVTIVLGVTEIDNASPQTVTGLDEETDAQLRVRRQKSVSLSSQGYLAGLLAAEENVSGVTSAAVIENNTGLPVVYGSDSLPANSIWVIVAESGATEADIAEAIYKKRNAGCGMYGSESYTVTQVDGTPFVVKWDEVTLQTLYIQLHVTNLDGSAYTNAALLKSTIPTLLTPGPNGRVNINELSTIVQEIDPNALVVPTAGDGFSAAAIGPFTPTLSPQSPKYQFNITAGNITVL